MQNVIQQSINLLERLKKSNPVFDFPCPICWFGNLESNKPLILTLSINPSDVEFKKNCLIVNGPINSTNLEDAYNHYFYSKPYNPYWSWFKPQEDILKPLNASYKNDPNSKYQLVHVDLFPFATNPNWRDANKLITSTEKGVIFAQGMRILERIIVKYNPKAIISFGELKTKVKELKAFNYSGNKLTQVPEKPKARSLCDGKIIVNGREVPIILTTYVAKDKGLIPFNQEHAKEIIRRAHALGV